MTAATASTALTTTGVVPVRGPSRTVTRLAMRLIRRSALIVIGLAAGMSALVVATYAGVMADPAAAGSLQALAGNPAIRTLLGEPVALDNAGGFTVWRVGTFVAVGLGMWAILATTRITRGEEDAGRWDVLLAGRVTLSTAVARPVMVVMSGQARRSEAAGGSWPRSAPAETTDKAAPAAATGWCYGWSSFWRTASGTARPGDNFRRAVGVCLVHGGSWDPNDKLFSSGPTGLVTVSGV